LPLRSLFFTVTATTEIYTLSLHDALPISENTSVSGGKAKARALVRKIRAHLTAPALIEAAGLKVEDTVPTAAVPVAASGRARARSEEHTSELQSRGHLVCRLLLEKKKPIT